MACRPRRPVSPLGRQRHARLSSTIQRLQPPLAGTPPSRTRGGVMLTRTRQSQMDKARETLRDVVSYADEVIRDERLRADIASAIGHGAAAGNRVKEDVDAGGIATRLASDKKLRRKLRATLDDLDSAGERLRPKRRHRLRKVMFVAVAAGVIAVIVPSLRRSLAHRTQEPSGDSLAAETLV